MKRHFTRLVCVAIAALCSLPLVAQGWSYPTETIQSSPYAGMGTKDDPYIISSAQQLADLSWEVNNGRTYKDAYFELGADIDLNPGFTFDKDGNITGDGEPQQWVPIGAHNEFMGNLDGKNHTIKGIVFLESKYHNLGLFGNVKNATIENISIENSLISMQDISDDYCLDDGFKRSFYLGFIAATAPGCTFINIHNTGMINVNDGNGNNSIYAGGIIGNAAETSDSFRDCYIDGCSNTGNISVVSYQYANVGGVAGWYYGNVMNSSNTGCIYTESGAAGGILGGGAADLENLTNKGQITAVDAFAGGIAGMAYATLIKNCNNEAKITGGTYSAGICSGEIHNVSDCSNTGTVICTNEKGYAGGILGLMNYMEKISNCKNTGDVIGYNCGGIGAMIGDYLEEGGIVEYCSNEGEIKAKDAAGGIASYMGFKILNNCHNTGEIMSEGNYVGGLIGYMPTWADAYYRLENCYNTASVTGVEGVGGLCGSVRSGDADICDSYNTGNIIGNKSVGGICGSRGNIIRSYNKGDVTASDRFVGGLNGGSCDSICYSYNLGNVSGDTWVGGISAGTIRKLSNSYNIGTVKGEEIVGGISGGGSSIYMEYSYNYGDILSDGVKYIGGIIGDLSMDGEFKNCYCRSMENIPPIGKDTYEWNKTGVEAIDDVCFSNGTLCILLNADQDPTPWGQEIGTDLYPVLSGTGNPATGIHSTYAEKPATGDDALYDLSGRRILKSDMRKNGVYISKGKKFVVK